jgi:uncharacterized phage protein (predicted DNA packaging)
MAMLDDVKIALRVSHTALNSEITDLIAAARQDLILAGVLPAKANSDSDALIKRAVTTYVKAHFGYDNPDHERLISAYTHLKMSLLLGDDYT